MCPNLDFWFEKKPSGNPARNSSSGWHGADKGGKKLKANIFEGIPLTVGGFLECFFYEFPCLKCTP
jgi:hypothetical protein